MATRKKATRKKKGARRGRRPGSSLDLDLGARLGGVIGERQAIPDEIEQEVRRRVQNQLARPYESTAATHFQLLREPEVHQAAISLGEDAGGVHFIGLHILLLEHLAKL